MPKQKITITKKSNLGQVIKKYPQTAEILAEYGLHCAVCPARQMDTIEQGAKIHGLSEDEMEEMVCQINKIIHNG